MGKSNRSQFQKDLHQIIFEADTRWGKLFDILLFILIVVSILMVMFESVEGIDIKYHQEIIIIEWLITIFFTIEYIARIIAVKKPWNYVKSFYGIIDLLAILPTYLAIFFVGGKSLVVIRSLRLLRVFRVLKLIQFSNALEVIRRSLYASRYKIIVFMIFVISLVTIIGSLMYIVEGQVNEGFNSIPKSIYWAVVTLTTVGFGDITPQTGFGRFLAGIIMILGYGIIAVPTGIVTSELVKTNPANTQNCSNCGAEEHNDRSKYCYKCGDELEVNNQ